MKLTKYKMGVVGLGEGRSIMSAALASERWELLQVCDINEELCKHRAEEFGFDRWTTSYGELLSDPEIDVIAIYTPDQLHLKHMVQALDAGKHVICTKPLLPSLEDASELLSAVERSGKTVFVGQSTRFFEPMMRQREDFEAGKHGELQTVEAHYNTDGRWFLEKGWSRQRGFSWMYGFMIHAVDLVRWYLPDITQVCGLARTSENTKAYGMDAWDSLRFIVRDREGRIGVISGSYAFPALSEAVEPSIGCTLRGTHGSSRSEYHNLRYHTHYAGEGEKTYGFDELFSYYFRFEGNSHHAGEYQNYIEYFAECLDLGVVPLPDPKEALDTIALMTAMERSVQLGGEWIQVSDIKGEVGL